MEAPPGDGGGGTSCRLEFAVQMTCQNCVDAIQSSLRGIPGLQVLHIQLDSQIVLVETSLSTEKAQSLLESTGRKAVLKGMGGAVPACYVGKGQIWTDDLQRAFDIRPRGRESFGGAAVAMMSGLVLVQGVVRFLQVSPQSCLIDGTIDGLEPGLHGLHVHEFGDVTGSCDSCGDHFNPYGECHGGPQDVHRHAGDLGNILAGADGRASFRMEDNQLKVHDIIGRSLVVDAGEDDLGHGSHPLSKLTGNSGGRVACGIIARSAGLFQNPKKICTCDGVTLWEERERPAAGANKKAAGQPTPHL
ncbi:copper chaperone for superoxide dismutase isoform X1 [Rhineura floridana]|uniref:copper chaperone for superoxide dismutase isoform X1 n=1 Tax=Rhineura floridana TaxID=261503 RepID=UPI002AC80AF8|nr:copper chaperone for superoxide dismutase isoform X1 [Rhineura floridana]